MKKPAFSLTTALDAAVRKRGPSKVSATKLLPSLRWANLFGFVKKKAVAPPSAPAPAAATARALAAKKTTPAAPVSAARRMLDEDEEMFGTGPIANARLRERARCEAIVCSAAGLKNPGFAKTIAFTSRMTRKEAIALLESTPAAATVDSRNQARADRNLRIGAHPGELSVSQTGAARMHVALAAEMARTQAQAPARVSTSTK